MTVNVTGGPASCDYQSISLKTALDKVIAAFLSSTLGYKAECDQGEVEVARLASSRHAVAELVHDGHVVALDDGPHLAPFAAGCVERLVAAQAVEPAITAGFGRALAPTPEDGACDDAQPGAGMPTDMPVLAGARLPLEPLALARAG